MKKIILVAFYFMVTWNDSSISGVRLCGDANDFVRHQVFTTRDRAKDFVKRLEGSDEAWCVKMYKMETIR